MVVTSSYTIVLLLGVLYELKIRDAFTWQEKLAFVRLDNKLKGRCDATVVS